jgi:hypothetical protein
MKIIKFVLPALPAVLLMAGVFALSSPSHAKPEYTKKEKKACAFCHVDAKKAPKELNDAGKYYQDHGLSLDGYKGK